MGTPYQRQRWLRQHPVDKRVWLGTAAFKLLGKQLTEVALTAKTVVSTLTEVQNTYLKAVQQGAQLLGVGDLLTAIREIEAYKNQVNRVVSDEEHGRLIQRTLARSEPCEHDL